MRVRVTAMSSGHLLRHGGRVVNPGMTVDIDSPLDLETDPPGGSVAFEEVKGSRTFEDEQGKALGVPDHERKAS